jgi:hypothetical protein
MAGSNSQLSDREREVFESPLSLLSSIKNKGYKLAAGDLSPMMKKDLLALADILETRSRSQSDKILGGIKKRSKAIAGENWNSSIEAEFPSSDELIVSSADFRADKPADTGSAAPGESTGMTPEKKARLEELRAKKAAGTLR